MADPQQGMRRRYVRWNEQDAVPPPQLSSNADQEARASLTRFSAEPDVLRGLYNRLTGDDAAAEAAYGRALQTQQRAAEQDSNVSTQWRDWGSVGDVAAGVRKVLTGSAPDMVLALGAGGVGRGLARRTVGNIERRAAVQQIEQRLANEGIDSLVGRKVAENAARKSAAAASPQVAQAQFQDAIDRTGADLVRRAPGAQGRIDAAGRAGFAGGLTAGSFPGVAAQNAQELSQTDREGTWRMMPYMGAQSALEAVMEGRLAGRALGNPYVKEALQEGLGATRGALSKLPGRIAKETGQNAATEAGTEGLQALLQTAGQRAGRGEDPLAFTDGDLAGALDQAIVGGLAGGAMGGSVEAVNASVPAAVDAAGRAVRAGAAAGRWAWDKTGGVRQALRERIRAAAEKRRSPLDVMDGGADPGAQDTPADLGARAGAAAKQAFDTAGTLFDKAKQGLTSAAQRFRGAQGDLTQADELDAQADGAMDWLQANVFEQQGQPPAARHPYTSKATSPLQAWALAKMNPAFLDTLPETEALRLGRAIEKYAHNSDLTGAESRLLRDAIAVPDSGLSRDMLNATALVAERVMQPQSKAFKDAEGNAPRLARPRGDGSDLAALTQDPGGADVVGLDVAASDSQDSAAALSRDWNSGFSEQDATDGGTPIDQLHSIGRSLDELRRGRPDLLKEQYAAWKQREPQIPEDPRLVPLIAERRKQWLAERPQFESQEQALTAQAAAIRERARASLENGVVFTRNDASDASRAFWNRKTAEHWVVPLKDPKKVVLRDGNRTIEQPQVVDLKVVVGRALAALNAEGTPNENIPLEAALARGLSDLATLGYRINFHKMPTGELRAGGQTLNVTPKLIRKIVRHVDRRAYGPWPERKGSKPKRSASEERALNNEYGRQDDASMYEAEPSDENAFLKQEYAQGARKPPPGARAPDGSFVPSIEVASDVSIKSPFEKHITAWRKERRIAQQRGAPPAVLRNINIKHGQKIGAELLEQEASNGNISPKRYDAEMRRLKAPNGTQAIKVLTRALRGDFDNISVRHPQSDLAERARGDAADPSGLRVIDKPEPRQFVKRTAKEAERRAAADARADAAARKAGREPAPSSVPAGTQQTGMILRAGREPVGKPREAHKDVIDVQQGTKRDALGRTYQGATVAAAPLAPRPKAVETTTRKPKEAPKRSGPEVFYRGKPVTQSPEAPSGVIPKDVRDAVAEASKRVKPDRASNRNGEYVDPPTPSAENLKTAMQSDAHSKAKAAVGGRKPDGAVMRARAADRASEERAERLRSQQGPAPRPDGKPETRLQEPEPGQPGSREAPHIIPMYYKIGNVLRLRKELRDSYSSSDSIAALIERGDRTGTTRQPPRGVLPGHYITFPGVKGLYRVTGFEKIDLLSDAGREAWSKREGWAPEAADTFGPQVQHGKIQMQFERVDTSQPSQRKHPTEEQEGAPQQATKDAVQNDELTAELTPEQSDAIDAGAKSASSDGRHNLKAERSMLNTILGMLGITEQIGALRTLQDADERGYKGGSYARRSRTVSINPNLHGAERVEVLMHELGHHIIWNEIAKYVDGGFDALQGMTLAESIDVLAKGNPKLYAALRKDFDQWNTTGRPSQSPTHRYLRKLTNGLTRTFKDDHHAFHEWFADNIARSLVGKRPVVGVVGKFFAKIATQLRKAWSVISATPSLKPAPSVDAWVKQMLNANVAAVKEATGQAAPQAKAEATVRGAVAAQAAKAGPVKYTMENLGDLVALIETVLPVESRQLLDRVFARVDVMNRLLAAYSGRADLDAMFGDPKKPGSGEAFVKRMLDHPSQGASARVAFGYLAWQDGLLKTGPQGQNALLGLSDSVLRLFGAAGDGALAQRTLYDIQTGAVQRFKDAGKIYSARDLAARNGNNFQRALNWVNRMVESSPASNALAAFWTGNNERMRKSGIPALRTLATMLDRPQGSIGESNPGLITNLRVQTARWNRRMREALEPLTDRQRLRVLRVLQRRAKAGDKAYDSLPENVRAAVDTIREMFRDAYRYQREAGYTENDLGHIRDYMPVIMDIRNPAAREKLTKLYSKPEYARDVAIAAGFVKPDGKGMFNDAEIKEVTSDPAQMAKAVEYLVRAAANDGQTPLPTGAAGRFHFRHQNTQLSAFIYRHGNPDDIKTLASLQTRDPGEVFARYFAPMVRWAEMARMFGEPEQVLTKNGDPVVDPTTGREVWHMNPRAKLDRLLDQVKKQGGTDDDVAFADNAVRAALGVYGADGSPTIAAVSPWAAEKLKGRKAQSVIEGVQAYQNVRLLPLALLSNLVDPVGIAVRTGGELNDAWAGFKEGMGFVRAALSKDPQAAKRMLKELEDIDVSEDVLPALAANPVFEGGRTGKARAVNDFVFKVNGVQTWVTATRVMAMYAGHKFLLRHAQRPNDHSARYLQELGLQPADIVEDPNNPGKVEINDKTRAALRQFVDEAILRPNSQQAPLWMSDPYMGIVVQYKMFSYAIWDQIGGRIGREITQGNMRVVVAALMYLPVIVMAELVREMIQTAGEGDDRRKDWGVLEYTKLAADRSGLLGPQYQIMGDIKGDIERSRLPGTSQLGPAINQGRNVLDALQGRRNPGKEFESALPGSPLYRKWNDGAGDGEAAAAT